MGMTDSQFKFSLRTLKRDLEETIEKIKTGKSKEAIEQLEDVLEDIQRTLED